MKKATTFCIALILFNYTFLRSQTSDSKTKYSQLGNIYKYVIPCESKKTGTCFITKYINEPVIMTAKHLLNNNINNGDSILIKLFKKNMEYISLLCSVHLDTIDNNIDIALLQPIEELGFSIPNDSKIEFGVTDFKVRPGEDITLLGFPASITRASYNLSSLGFPLPITKTVKYSTTLNISGTKNILFDGSVSPGMSGGPALYYNEEKGKWMLLGVVQSTLIDYSFSPDNRLRVGFSADFSTGAFPQMNFALR